MAYEDELNRKIGNKFYEIEERLKLTFKSIRGDISYIKEKLDKPTSDSEIKYELKQINEKISTRFNEVNKQISNLNNKIASKEDLEKIKVDFDSQITTLKKQISKSGIKEEITQSLNEKITEEITKITDKFSELKSSFSKDFSSYKTERDKENKETIKHLEKERNDLIQRSEKEKQEILEQTKKEIFDLKKEITKKNNELLEKLNEKEDRINTLQGQISYLKGRVNKTQPEEPQQKSKITLTPIKTHEPGKTKDILFKTLKVLIIIIPLILIGYIIYANFLVSHTFNSFYDIGSNEDAKKSFLSPTNRISEADINASSRNLTSSLVYFNIQIPKGSDKVDVSIKFKDNFPNNSYISLGAQDQQVWHYSYKNIYNPILNQLNNYQYTGNETRIYQINKDMPLISNISEIPKNSIVASNVEIQSSITTQKYNITPLTINTGLRGGHTFYIYLKDNLNLTVKKQDINWYNNSDDLIINLYDLNNNLIANTTILDDGITNVDKSTAKIQDGQLIATNLTEGIYKLQFTDFDGVIREMSLNTNKIVTNKLFLSDFEGYITGSQKPSSIYTKANKNSDITFRTYHSGAFQNISINNDYFSINSLTDLKYQTPSEEYTIESKINDIIISSPNYLSFSKDSYFEPFDYSITSIPSDLSKVDYVITDYYPIEKQGDWIIGKASYNVKDLYIKDGKLSMLINTPHLGKEETQNNTIPVDWVNITVYKNGLFKI
ncbi:MAG: hypothetical protein Q7S33_04960 [Nanoarchaeota archaeon]|nr:hypothetical protein [Nanoarchaeota archaeon]